MPSLNMYICKWTYNGTRYKKSPVFLRIKQAMPMGLHKVAHTMLDTREQAESRRPPPTTTPAPNCIKHFHWTIGLFWPIRFDVTIVSSGNNCSAKPD